MLDDAHPHGTDPWVLPLPDRPADLRDRSVAVWRQPVTMPTYLPGEPSPYPAYLDQRVYQGSSGRVYPLPFHDRIESTPRDVAWDGVHLENAWVRLLVLPQLGGRIHVARERSTGQDFFYGNPVIKPALVGLAGPWLAGGVELNWPQHHRPATFLPVDVEIEEEPDGAVTVWCSDHDPFDRLKGMHGIRLRPEASTIELRVRLYNRTPLTQTFLWWANVAARTHRDYQSFFPADVTLVADHAKRAVCAFPAADRPYYSIDYPARREALTRVADGSFVRGDRLDWPSNIPVPTSYMVLHSDHDFFGGYDHAAGIGFIHVADRRIAPGKKQWTWGDAAFGHAWSRNLADDGTQYVELMAGAFTDNQPDFAYLAPGETKVFSQFWYPILGVGPIHEATPEAAVSLVRDGAMATVGVVVTRPRAGVRVELVDEAGAVLATRAADLTPAGPLLWRDLDAPGLARVRVVHDGAELVALNAATLDAATMGGAARTDHPAPQDDERLRPAQEPPAPAEVDDVERLLLIAEHLEQYRHATRSPEDYWAEALRREPDHARANTAVGIRRLRQGRLAEAERHLRAAVARLTELHPTPSDGRGLYHLGLVLGLEGRTDEAYERLARAAWDRAWRAPAGYQLARLDGAAGRNVTARERLNDVLRTEPEHLQALTLRAIVQRRLGDDSAADDDLAAVQALDPLHWWSRAVAGDLPDDAPDAQTVLDVALEQAAVGEHESALRLLGEAERRDAHRPLGQTAVGPLAALHKAHLLERLGRHDEATAALAAADRADRRHAFPGRLEDALVLIALVETHPDHATARVLLGYWLYAAGRHADALALWREAVALGDEDPAVHRCIGLALAAVHGDLEGARAAYDRALELAPDDPQLWHESDRLDQRRGVPTAERLRRLDARRDLVAHRDDLTVAFAHLLVDEHRAQEARDLLAGRAFQPWEGGEGETLRAWERACAALAREALASDDTDLAARLVDDALFPPDTLGEARHPLASTAELHLLAGDVADAAGRGADAAAHWEAAAASTGDFVAMSTDDVGPATVFSVKALRRLGRHDDARRLTDRIAERAHELATTPATIDYFATSLPQLLLFPPDLTDQRREAARALADQVDLLRADEHEGSVA